MGRNNIKDSVVDYDSTDEQRLRTLLRKDGFSISKMSGDGNCLFRSLADQLNQLSTKSYDHIYVREKIVNYIEANKETFQLFIEDDENVSDYIDRIRQPYEWGGYHELYAFTQIFKLDVVVYQVTGPKYIIQYSNITSNRNSSSNSTGSRSTSSSNNRSNRSNGRNSNSSHSYNSSNNIDKRISKSVQISFHGDCHYNSVVPLRHSGTKDYVMFDKVDADDRSNRSENCNLAKNIEEVKLSLSWKSDKVIEYALKVSDNDVVKAIDFLTCNSDIDEDAIGEDGDTANECFTDVMSKKEKRSMKKISVGNLNATSKTGAIVL